VKRFEQINVIPFVDIMLVLLAIVLMTATFVSQGKIRVDLPPSRYAQTVGGEQGRQITVMASGIVYLDGVEVELSTLEATVANWPQGTLVQLAVDRHAAFEHFVAVLDLLRLNELTRLQVVTRQEK
jgi:biopolymer transport protein ExbD